ncbi:MAG: hypothetical protein K2H84_02380, partial [Paramuribaculum sp.]|nr:hypothetical protein [Paramuribaculum sp.]
LLHTMKNFTFARKWHKVLQSYSEEIQKEVYRAAVEYAFTGSIVEMQPLARMAFDFIRYEIDEKTRRREARLAKKQAQESATVESAVVGGKADNGDQSDKPVDKSDKSADKSSVNSKENSNAHARRPGAKQQPNRSAQPIWLF